MILLQTITRWYSCEVMGGYYNHRIAVRIFAWNERKDQKRKWRYAVCFYNSQSCSRVLPPEEWWEFEGLPPWCCWYMDFKSCSEACPLLATRKPKDRHNFSRCCPPVLVSDRDILILVFIFSEDATGLLHRMTFRWQHWATTIFIIFFFIRVRVSFSPGKSLSPEGCVLGRISTS